MREASVVNFTALSTPCECAGKSENCNPSPVLEHSRSSLSEKPSASAGSQIPLCERLIRFDQCLAS